jgi:hypothetical protein
MLVSESEDAFQVTTGRPFGCQRPLATSPERGENMKTHSKIVLLFCVVLFGVLFSQEVLAQPPQPQKSTTNVEGRWTVYLVNTNGTTATQLVDFEQNGHSLTGHFKGPDQSGEITGSVNGGDILFQTKTPNVLIFSGHVYGYRAHQSTQGSSISGTFHSTIEAGKWEASRSN